MRLLEELGSHPADPVSDCGMPWVGWNGGPQLDLMLQVQLLVLQV